jgi:hypothetical protein
VQRYLYRVTYTFDDGTVAYEPVCVRAEDGDAAGALEEVVGATERYATIAPASRSYTLVLVTADA